MSVFTECVVAYDFNTVGDYVVIAPPIKPCQNQAAYLVKGALKKEQTLEGFSCKDFKCERTLCFNSSFVCEDALFPTERFKSLFTSSSGLYSGAYGGRKKLQFCPCVLQAISEHLLNDAHANYQVSEILSFRHHE